MSLCVRQDCPGLKCQGRGLGCPVELPRDQRILLGVLSENIFISFLDGKWSLVTFTVGMNSDLGDQEIICHHENWDQFMELVSEYSDYEDGE